MIVVALAACSSDDPGPLGPATDLAIVAHPDDDLLFMQPDLVDVVARGDATTVYVSAGGDLARAGLRSRGVMSAYAAAAGVPSEWDCGPLEIAGHTVAHCRLEAARISLVFLGYPDGGKRGERPQSLLRLWGGEINEVETIAHVPTTYDRDGLVDVLAEVVRVTAPRTLRTLDVAGTHGHDHSDHLVVGALATLAATHAGHAGELRWYRGYNIESELPNVPEEAHARAVDMLARYHACASDCGTCGEASCAAIPEQHLAWSQRGYATARMDIDHGVALRLGDRCATFDKRGAIVLGDCEDAPSWQLSPAGQLMSAAACARTDEVGVLVASPRCVDTGVDRVVLDSEGRLWSGREPAPEQVDATTRALCLGTDGVSIRALPCGPRNAPRWNLVTR